MDFKLTSYTYWGKEFRTEEGLTESQANVLAKELADKGFGIKLVKILEDGSEKIIKMAPATNNCRA